MCDQFYIMAKSMLQSVCLRTTTVHENFTTCREKCADSNGEGPRLIGAAVPESLAYQLEVCTKLGDIMMTSLTCPD